MLHWYMSEPTYEENIAELKKCVDQLESGKLGLEESLDVHTRATNLSNKAMLQLINAEKRINAEANKK